MSSSIFQSKMDSIILFVICYPLKFSSIVFQITEISYGFTGVTMYVVISSFETIRLGQRKIIKKNCKELLFVTSAYNFSKSLQNTFSFFEFPWHLGSCWWCFRIAVALPHFYFNRGGTDNGLSTVLAALKFMLSYIAFI